jgi:hypothetical protein
MKITLYLLTAGFMLFPKFNIGQKTTTGIKHYLYVVTPGIRDYLGYGGHGILVFDMDKGHQFVKRIKTEGYHPDSTPSNVKGVAVSIPLNSIYISTLESLQRIDLTTEKLVWEKTLKGAATVCPFHLMGKQCTCHPSKRIFGT